MKFSTREDVEAPAEFVFQQFADFEVFERQALRRGADVQRRDTGPVRTGSIWDVAFSFRGKDRKLSAELTRLDSPQLIHVSSKSGGIDGLTAIELVPLSPQRTRIAVSIELRASSLSARLLLQSLKLAKSNLTARFKKRVAVYASDIEDRYKGPRTTRA